MVGLFVLVFGLFNHMEFDTTLMAEQVFESPVIIKPSISCRSVDKVNTKAALLTSDEYVLAGGKVSEDLEGSNYLRFNNSYWTMSPIFMNDDVTYNIYSW